MNAAGRPCEIEYEVNGYSKIVFLDEDGNRTSEATPVCPEWIQAPDGEYPYEPVPEENTEPEPFHRAKMMWIPTQQDEELVETCLQALNAHKANKWVVSSVHMESVLRLGSYSSGYINDEVVHYLLQHHTKVFGLPKDHEHSVLFNSSFVDKMKNVYQEQTLTCTPEELHRY